MDNQWTKVSYVVKSNEPATSVSSESTFSLSAFLGRKERAHLTEDNLSSSVCVWKTNSFFDLSVYVKFFFLWFGYSAQLSIVFRTSYKYRILIWWTTSAFLPHLTSECPIVFIVHDQFFVRFGTRIIQLLNISSILCSPYLFLYFLLLWCLIVFFPLFSLELSFTIWLFIEEERLVDLFFSYFWKLFPFLNSWMEEMLIVGCLFFLFPQEDLSYGFSSCSFKNDFSFFIRTWRRVVFFRWSSRWVGDG